MQSVVAAAVGEDVLQEQSSAGLDGGEAVFVTDAVNGSVELPQSLGRGVQHGQLPAGLS